MSNLVNDKVASFGETHLLLLHFVGYDNIGIAITINITYIHTPWSS